MAPRKKPKYGPPGSAFSKQAIAFYKALGKQNRAGGGGRGSFSSGAPASRVTPPAAPGPKAAITRVAVDQQRTRDYLRDVARKRDELRAIARKQEQARARPQQFAGARGGGGLIGSKPPAKPAPKPKEAPKPAPKRGGGKSAFDVVGRLQGAGLTPTSAKAKARAREDAERKHAPFGGIPGVRGEKPKPKPGKPGKPGTGPQPLAAPGKPSPVEILAFTEAANRNRLENLDVGDPGPPSGTEATGEAAFPGTLDDWLARAVAIAAEREGLPPETAPLWRQGVEQEGGRNVYQRGYRDVNTGRDPAFGPAQVIGSTFDTHKMPGYENRFNPIHNILAGMRYSRAKRGGDWWAGARYMAQPGGY